MLCPVGFVRKSHHRADSGPESLLPERWVNTISKTVPVLDIHNAEHLMQCFLNLLDLFWEGEANLW